MSEREVSPAALRQLYVLREKLGADQAINAFLRIHKVSKGVGGQEGTAEEEGCRDPGVCMVCGPPNRLDQFRFLCRGCYGGLPLELRRSLQGYRGLETQKGYGIGRKHLQKRLEAVEWLKLSKRLAASETSAERLDREASTERDPPKTVDELRDVLERLPDEQAQRRREREERERKRKNREYEEAERRYGVPPASALSVEVAPTAVLKGGEK